MILNHFMCINTAKVEANHSLYIHAHTDIHTHIYVAFLSEKPAGTNLRINAKLKRPLWGVILRVSGGAPSLWRPEDKGALWDSGGK